MKHIFPGSHNSSMIAVVLQLLESLSSNRLTLFFFILKHSEKTEPVRGRSWLLDRSRDIDLFNPIVWYQQGSTQQSSHFIAKLMLAKGASSLCVYCENRVSWYLKINIHVHSTYGNIVNQTQLGILVRVFTSSSGCFCSCHFVVMLY